MGGAPLRELGGHAVGVVGRLGFDDLFKTRCRCGRAEPSPGAALADDDPNPSADVGSLFHYSYQHESLGRHDCKPVRLRDSLAAQSIESLCADVVKYTTAKRSMAESLSVKARTVQVQHATVST